MSYDGSTRNVSDVIRNTKRQFGDESNVQITNTDIIRWINDAQREIAGQLRHLKGRAVMNLVPGTSAYVYPIENIVQVDALILDGKTLPFMNFMDAREIIDKNSEDATGKPDFYYAWGKELMFYPAPVEPHVVEMYFARFPQDITSETDPLSIPDKNYDSLIDYVLAKAYELDEDNDAARNLRSTFAARLLEQTDEEQNMQNSLYPSITILEE